jgi:2-keto-3-deoxy-galactonokinase
MDDAVSMIFECLCHGASLAKTPPLSSQTANRARLVEMPGEESRGVFLPDGLAKRSGEVIDVMRDVGEPARVMAAGDWDVIERLRPVP